MNTPIPLEEAEKIQSLTKIRDMLATHSDAIISRSNLFSQLGQQYDGDRDMYVTLGYKKTLVFTDYEGVYKRQDVAKRIIDAPPDATWRGEPVITDLDSTPDEGSEFDKAWLKMARDLKMWHYFTRVDKLAGIGRYGVLVLGFNDARDQKDLANPVKQSNSLALTHLRPFSEGNAEVASFDNDITSSRHGLPDTYNIEVAGDQSGDVDLDNKSILVHWSRILHVADDLTENETFGTPRLEAVFNRLFDLEKTVGGNAEMFWRGAFPGYNFKLDPEAELQPSDVDDLQQQIDDYIHKISRYMRTQGIDIEELAQEVADPEPTFNVIIKLISAATGIPARILTGSERGEMASSQDENNWNTRIDERRNDFANPIVIRPFVNRLMELNLLPKTEYTIIWPDPIPLDAKTNSEVNHNNTKALVEYAESPAARSIIPEEVYLTQFIGMNEDEAKALVQDTIDDLDGEDDFDFDETDDITEE